ncbi:unnamed protein product [Parnassius apollo]|uniref:(apollo) hypothetical protein n=1 Tax=Parnassius apollo TaxID=110799 RepID=A0A8S3XTU1_PARAO|nr:unnamed protein product [Parnassius apollo]
MLYESLERPMVSGTGPAPNQADTVTFWRGLWSEPVNHSESPWTEVVASFGNRYKMMLESLEGQDPHMIQLLVFSFCDLIAKT